MGFSDYGRCATQNNRRLQNNLGRDFKTKRFNSPCFENFVDNYSKEEKELREKKIKNIERATQQETLIEITLMFIVSFVLFFIWYIRVYD